MYEIKAIYFTNSNSLTTICVQNKYVANNESLLLGYCATNRGQHFKMDKINIINSYKDINLVLLKEMPSLQCKG